MVKPVSLAKRRLAPVPSTVALLTELLRRAKRGEIRGVAVACACDAGCDGSAYDVGDGTIAALNLALDRVKVRVLAHEG